MEIKTNLIITKLTKSFFYLFILIIARDQLLCEAQRYRCGKPEVPQNGDVVQHSHTLYRYTCDKGFKLVATSMYRKCTKEEQWEPLAVPKCEDIDECKLRGTNHPCGANANCLNTMGSFKCTCQSGYHGNGVRCKPEFNRFENHLQDDSTCGIVSNPLSHVGSRVRRVIHGQHSKAGQWPWMALITVNNGPVTILGGALIRPGWVLTVASLLHKAHGLVKEDDVIVTLGEHDINRPAIEEQQFRVKRIHINPKFNRTNLKNDIALLELETNAEINDHVNTICLLSKKKARKFERGRHLATIAGWGLTEPKNIRDFYSSTPRLYSGELRDVTLTIFGPHKCKRTTNYMYYKKKMLCAGSTNNTSAPCLGDVGSPLFLKDPETDRWSILGVYSWSEGCGQPSKYSYYTKIAPYRTWIENMTRLKNNVI